MNLKEMRFYVEDNNEAVVVLDVLSIAKHIHKAEISDDVLHINNLFDADMISEERINRMIMRFLVDSQELEEFYNRLAEIE